MLPPGSAAILAASFVAPFRVLCIMPLISSPGRNSTGAVKIAALPEGPCLRLALVCGSNA